MDKLKLNDIVYIVFQAKRLNHNRNIVFKGRVTGIMLDKFYGDVELEKKRYRINLLKCMNDKSFLMCTVVNNIWTWENEVNSMKSKRVSYPVFTKKENCIKWLKGDNYEKPHSSRNRSVL